MSPRERLALDIVVLAGVALAANPLVTGIALHEWIGFVLVIPAVVHLVINWDWVVRTLASFFGKLRATSRLNLAVDTGLFVSVVGVTVSGFLVIPGLAASLGLEASAAWHVVHLATSDLTVGFMIVHLTLHARWIGAVVARMIAPPSIPAHATQRSSAALGRPASAHYAAASITRR